MTAYADTSFKPFRSFTQADQKLLLKVTGEHRAGFRDHILLSLALATALREHEALALDVGDLFDERGRPRIRVQLRVFKRSNPDRAMQEVVLPQALRVKLDKFYRHKVAAGEGVAPDAPLFVSRQHRRLSTRQARRLFQIWQERAGIERPLGFHGLRHSACSNLYGQTKDLRLTQRFARHRSILSTMRYTNPSDEVLVRSVQSLPC
jgi:site-specific recombinase XerD